MQGQMLIQSVANELWNIDERGMKSMEQSVLRLLQINSAHELVPILRSCIANPKKIENLVGYLGLLDLLLNHPIYSQILHSVLIEIYPTIIFYLSSNKFMK